jgi:hypothetical protein
LCINVRSQLSACYQLRHALNVSEVYVVTHELLVSSNFIYRDLFLYKKTDSPIFH